MNTPESTTPDDGSPVRRSSLTGKLAAVGVTGLLVGAAVAIGSMASADAPATSEPAQLPAVSGSIAAVDDEDAPDMSDEDEAVWQRFDDCLAEAGVMLDPGEPDGDEDAVAEPIEIDEDAIEACEAILDELSEDGAEMLDEFELSPEDEAVFERFEACLVENGVPAFDDDLTDADGDIAEPTDAEWEAIEQAWEQAEEACDPILEDLSEDVFFGEGCDVDDELFGEDDDDEAPADEVDDDDDADEAADADDNEDDVA